MNELEKKSEVVERRQWGPRKQWREGTGWHWERMLQNCVLTGMRSNNDDYMWSWVTGDYWASIIFNLRLTPRKLLDLLVLKLWKNFQICGLSLSPINWNEHISAYEAYLYLLSKATCTLVGEILHCLVSFIPISSGSCVRSFSPTLRYETFVRYLKYT